MRKSVVVLVAVFALALGVRVLAIQWVSHHEFGPHRDGDAPEYHELAVNLSRGSGYVMAWQGGGPDKGELKPTALRAPLMPAVVSLVYRVAGPNPYVARYFLAGVDALACALLALLGMRLVSPAVGATAGALAALYPTEWANNFLLHAETLFAACLVAALLAAERFRVRRSVASGAGLGLALALVALARPNGLIVTVTLTGWAVVTGWRSRAGRRALLVCVAVIFLAVGPWVVRTYVEVGVVAPVTTQAAPVLSGYYSPLVAHHPVGWGGWDVGTVLALRAQSSSEAEYYRLGQRAGIDAITDDPIRSFRIMGLHVFRYFDLYWQQEGRMKLLWYPSRYRGVNEAAVVSWWLVATGACVGIWRTRRARLFAPLVPALTVYVALAVAAILLGASTRLRAPTDGVVLLLAAIGVWGNPVTKSGAPREPKDSSNAEP